MIKDVDAWNEWEREYRRNQPVDFHQNLKIMEAMFEHAKAMGALRDPKSLDGLEVRIRIAKAVNAVRPS